MGDTRVLWVNIPYMDPMGLSCLCFKKSSLNSSLNPSSNQRGSKMRMQGRDLTHLRRAPPASICLRFETLPFLETEVQKSCHIAHLTADPNSLWKDVVFSCCLGKSSPKEGPNESLRELIKSEKYRNVTFCLKLENSWMRIEDVRTFLHGKSPLRASVRFT